MTSKQIWLFLLLFCCGFSAAAQVLRRKIPDKLVVLTFDDASASHATFVAPLLKKYGFGGTFFVCEFPPDFADKTKYMSWEQMQQLDRQGFEVGNHTRSHNHINKLTRGQQAAELGYIEDRCRQLGMKKPLTFAYPGYSLHATALETLAERDYRFARAGGSRPYDPEKDHPYLLPSYSTTGTDTTRVLNAIQQARDGKIVILTVHGVPDTAHDWVSTPPEIFEVYLRYLKRHHYKVVALRDLARYVNADKARRTITPDLSNLISTP